MLHYKLFKHNEEDKKWITFIHGAGGSSSIWFKQLKDFKQHFHVLLIDLRGHGNSKSHLKQNHFPTYTFESVSKEVVDVLNHLKIEKSHFVGISLGTIIIREIAEKHPERVSKMVMGGAILKLNFRSQILMRLGIIFKSVIPYILLYKLFAWIIMPKKKHRESRLLFVREAKKLYQKEFIRWFRMAAELNPLLKGYRAKHTDHSTLYLMGDEDHMFLPTIERLVENAANPKVSLEVIPQCGHVVNVEKPQLFNRKVLEYLEQANS